MIFIQATYLIVLSGCVFAVGYGSAYSKYEDFEDSLKKVEKTNYNSGGKAGNADVNGEGASNFGYRKAAAYLIALLVCVFAVGYASAAIKSEDSEVASNRLEKTNCNTGDKAGSAEIKGDRLGSFGYRKAEVHKSYDFGYTSNDGNYNVHYRNKQVDEHGNVRGSYGYSDAQGLYRNVEYVADANGYRATIRTNESGVATKENPADVIFTVDEPPASVQVKNTIVANSFGGGIGFHATNRTNESGVYGKETPVGITHIEKRPAGVQEKNTSVTNASEGIASYGDRTRRVSDLGGPRKVFKHEFRGYVRDSAGQHRVDCEPSLKLLTPLSGKFCKKLKK